MFTLQANDRSTEKLLAIYAGEGGENMPKKCLLKGVFLHFYINRIFLADMFCLIY